jgi:hypothetical protein
MTDNYKGVLALLGLLSLLGFIATYLWSGGQVPRYLVNAPEDDLLQAFNHMSLVPETAGDKCPEHPYQPGFHNYQDPMWDNAPRVFTPHRYPRVAGGNISLIIHKGWGQMMQPAPSDGDWMDLPPADNNCLRAGQPVSYSL